MSSIIVFVVTAGLVATPTRVCAQPQPLSIPSRAPVFDTRLSYLPGPIDVLSPGQKELFVGASHVNVWAQMPHYFWDGEFLRLQLQLGFGMKEGTDVHLSFGAQRQSGGFMDALIEGFHALLHITQARRDHYPRDQLCIKTCPGEKAFACRSNADTGWSIVAPTLHARHRLYQSPSGRAQALFEGALTVFALGAESKVNVAGAAGRVGLALTQPIANRVQLFIAAGMIGHVGQKDMYQMRLARLQKYMMLGIGVALGPHAAVVAQYLGHDAGIEQARYYPLSASLYEFALGLRWHIEAPKAPYLAMEGAIIENTVHDANTPDFGVALAARLRARP